MNTDLVRKIEEKAKARRNPQSSAVDASWLSDTRESARSRFVRLLGASGCVSEMGEPKRGLVSWLGRCVRGFFGW